MRGKVLGKPIYELLGGLVREEIALYTHPNQARFTSKEAVVREIRDIVESATPGSNSIRSRIRVPASMAWPAKGGTAISTAA
ncbi:hypothetical protein ACVOMV_19930 [Mesorhizobium atlanticum]